MTLYLPIGIPGSGKSFFGAQHFTKNEIVCADDIREWMTGDRGNQRVNQAAFEVCNKIALERVSRGLDVYYDATNLTPKFWPRFPCDMTAILMDTPIRVCYERNSKRDNPVPEVAMRRMTEQLGQLQLSDKTFHIVVTNPNKFVRK